MRSLYRRMTVTHTLVALLAVLLVALLAGGLILRAYRDVSAGQAARQSRAVAERLSRPLAQIFITNRGWAGAAARVGPWIERDELDGRLVLSDTAGRVLYDSAGELEGRPVPARMRPLGVPIVARGSAVGYVAVVPGEEARAAADRAFVRALAGIVVAGSLAAVGMALLVAVFVARRLVRPLRELTVGARRLAAGGAHEPIAVPQDAELAELAHAFNAMAAELERQERLRRQMVADIAHELRTPLSVLRLQVESIEDGLVPASPQAVGALGGELDLLGRLVDDLRLLSLADAGQLSLAPQPVGPRDALEAAARAAEARARQGRLTLRVDDPGPLPAVRADPQRLAQILGNLVENALRYTPAGGEIVLSAASASPDRVRLSVRDSGPGIPPDELPRVFERFFRADRARARESGGSGLGLAIVQRLAAAHGGSVAVESVVGKGSVFSVIFPVA
jgi:two-component system sensor histidine kinase BaeS